MNKFYTLTITELNTDKVLLKDSAGNREALKKVWLEFTAKRTEAGDLTSLSGSIKRRHI